MLKKLLNPFGIKMTLSNNLPGKLWIVLGICTTLFLHGAFYFTIFHFLRKVW